MQIIDFFHRCFSNILLVKTMTWFLHKWNNVRKWVKKLIEQLCHISQSMSSFVAAKCLEILFSLSENMDTLPNHELAFGAPHLALLLQRLRYSSAKQLVFTACSWNPNEPTRIPSINAFDSYSSLVRDSIKIVLTKDYFFCTYIILNNYRPNLPSYINQSLIKRTDWFLCRDNFDLKWVSDNNSKKNFNKYHP